MKAKIFQYLKATIKSTFNCSISIGFSNLQTLVNCTAPERNKMRLVHSESHSHLFKRWRHKSSLYAGMLNSFGYWFRHAFVCRAFVAHFLSHTFFIAKSSPHFGMFWIWCLFAITIVLALFCFSATWRKYYWRRGNSVKWAFLKKHLLNGIADVAKF